jgi:lysophospholipase L1-like esterase
VRRSVAAIAVLLAGLAGCTPESGAGPAPSGWTASAPTASPSTTGAPLSSLKQVKVLGVIGDSISIGVNACGQPGPCPDRAWAGGSDPEVESIATRLADVSGTKPMVLRGAKDGGTVADASARMSELAAEKPDLVTVLVGANDVCAPSAAEMTSVAEFRKDYGAMLAKLRSQAPGALALALSIPDISQIWQVSKDNPQAVSLWSRFPGCRNLLSNPASDAPEAEAEREAAAERIVEFNQVVAELCRTAGNCISDGGAIYDHEYTAAEISSIDYFHPSAQGQRVIAEVAWRVLTDQVES